MDIRFKNRVDQLPQKLSELEACIPKVRLNLKNIPEKGVYLFLENGRPVYVGRTDRMRGRLMEHGRRCSKHNDASFAFKLAKEMATAEGIDTSRPRQQLVQDEAFDRFFVAAKERVSSMNIKHIEIIDPIDQYLLEVYVAEILATPYNDFENH